MKCQTVTNETIMCRKIVECLYATHVLAEKTGSRVRHCTRGLPRIGEPPHIPLSPFRSIPHPLSSLSLSVCSATHLPSCPSHRCSLSTRVSQSILTLPVRGRLVRGCWTECRNGDEARGKYCEKWNKKGGKALSPISILLVLVYIRFLLCQSVPAATFRLSCCWICAIKNGRLIGCIEHNFALFSFLLFRYTPSLYTLCCLYFRAWRRRPITIQNLFTRFISDGFACRLSELLSAKFIYYNAQSRPCQTYFVLLLTIFYIRITAHSIRERIERAFAPFLWPVFCHWALNVAASFQGLFMQYEYRVKCKNEIR